MQTIEAQTKTPSLNDLFKQIYSRRYQSVWTACLGVNQSGKTDFNLLQLERLHALGLGDGFGSNIKGLKADFDIDFIEDYETLKKRCMMLNPDPEAHGLKRYFFVADEMGDWAAKDMPWLNVQFIKELQQVRKYGLCFLGTGIDRIDDRILNEKHFHGYFVKLSKANPTIARYFDWVRHRTVRLRGIPRTGIKFSTWYSASFYMKPQNQDSPLVPRDLEHQMIVDYLKNGKSWDKTQYKRWQGKRAVDKVLEIYMALYKQPSQDEPNKQKVSSASGEDVNA